MRVQAFCILLLLGGCLLFPLGATAHEVRGDLDGDGAVRLNDALLALQMALRLMSPTEDQLEDADIAPEPGIGPKQGKAWGDGRVDVRDVMAILRIAIGLTQPPDPNPITLARIQMEVFNPSCAFSSCHGLKGRRAGLILQEGYAYDSLINVDATNPAAAARGWKRVIPGKPEQSFLLRKLTTPGPDEGSLMPQGSKGLPPDKIALIRRWIAQGAPKGEGVGNEFIPTPPVQNKEGDVMLPPPGVDQGAKILSTGTFGNPAWGSYTVTEKGFQIVIGPFEVPFGTEIQRNYYLKIPFDQEVYCNQVTFAVNEGTHHVNIFKSDDRDLPEYFDETFSAVAWESWDLVVDTQNEGFTWKFPPGVAFFLRPRQQMNFQVHYVNSSFQPTPNSRGKVIVNFWTIPKNQVQSVMGAMFAQNRQINLPPKQESSFSKLCIFPHDVKILAMTGHFHNRGKLFRVYKWSNGQPRELIYISAAWDEPPFKIYEKPIEIKAGEGLYYITTYYNDTDRYIGFGPEVLKDEHANLFVFFYPGRADGKAIYCF